MYTSKEESQQTLNDVQKIIARTKKKLASSHLSPMLMLWGAIWTLIYVLPVLIPTLYARYVPLALTLAGTIGTIVLFRRSPVRIKGTLKDFLPIFILLFYAHLWSFLLIPNDGVFPADLSVGKRQGIFFATVFMGMYVVLGIFTEKFLTWLGAFVTIVAVASIYLPDTYCFLVLGLIGGGAIMVTGFYISRKWR